MKIRFANNIGVISGDSKIAPEEISGKAGIERVSTLSKEAIGIAHELFKAHPEFKQITLDTMTDEERRLLKEASKGGAS